MELFSLDSINCKTCNIDLIKGFILPLPVEVMEDATVREKLSNHFKECYETIEEKLPEMKEKLRSLEKDYEKK